MKTLPVLISVSLLALGVAACSPSTPATDTSSAAASESVAVSEAVADDTVETAAESSAASSVTTVVAKATDTYDPVVIQTVGRKPGYWELRHTDPKTKKMVIDKICVDQPTGDRLVRDGGRLAPPADHRDDKTTANWLGVCPSSVKPGEVVRHDGKTLDAWNGQHPGQNHDQTHDQDHDQMPGKDAHDGQGPGNNDKGNDRGHDQKDGHNMTPPSAASSSSSESAPQHNPHVTPGEANKAMGHDGGHPSSDRKKD